MSHNEDNWFEKKSVVNLANDFGIYKIYGNWKYNEFPYYKYINLLIKKSASRIKFNFII